MNARATAILVILLVVLGGGAILYYQQEKSERADNAAVLGKPLLPSLKAAEVATIRIVEPKATLTLAQKNDGWAIAERGDFPADVAKVREFVVQALELKVGQSDPIGDKDRARLNLDASGTRVEFANATGQSLAGLIVGKKYFKREVEDSAKAQPDGRFVARPAEPKTAYLVSNPLPQATAQSAAWIDRTGFQVEKVKSLEVRFPDGGGWRIERDGDNADWRLDGLKAPEKLDVTRANSASYSLSLLQLADVAAKGSEDAAFEQPVSVDATTLDGLAYAIKVGKLEGDNYPVRFTVSGTPKDEKDAARQKKLEERVAREKRLTDYVLLVPKAKLEDTLKKRPDLLQKKDESKK